MKIEIDEKWLLHLGEQSVRNGTQAAWTEIALEWLEWHLEYLKEENCEHQLVDARNEIIKSGYVCIKCQKLFGAADQ